MVNQVTPKVKIAIDMDHPAIVEALKIAREEGRNEGRKDLLDWLEDAYINDPGRPDRGTPKAEAILELAKAASKHIQKLRGK